MLDVFFFWGNKCNVAWLKLAGGVVGVVDNISWIIAVNMGWEISGRSL